MLIECLHGILLPALGNEVPDFTQPALFEHQLPYRSRHAHYLHRRHAAKAVLAWQQSLRHHRHERFCKSHAHGVLLVGRKHRQHTHHGALRVRCVQRRKEQMPRLRRLHGGVDRLRVAHFSNENHVRILPQRGAQSHAETFRVHTNLALCHRTLKVAVQKLQRVLQRHNVLLLRGVDVVDHCRHGTRFSGPRRPGDEHHAALRASNSLEHVGQMQRLEGRHLKRNHTHDDHEARPLPQDVHAEPAHALCAPRAVVVLQ